MAPKDKKKQDYRNSLLTRYLSLKDWPLQCPSRSVVAKAGFYRDPRTSGLTNVTCCKCLVTCRLSEGLNLIAAHRRGFEFGREYKENVVTMKTLASLVKQREDVERQLRIQQCGELSQTEKPPDYSPEQTSLDDKSHHQAL